MPNEHPGEDMGAKSVRSSINAYDLTRMHLV